MWHLFLTNEHKSLTNYEQYTMKTNQIMTVTLLDGALEIGHLDMFGDLNAIFSIGNRMRVSKGLPLIRIEQWRTLTGVKEFMKRVGEEIGEPALRTARGKSGGIKAHLYILLDAAAYLSADLKLEMYKKFVEGKLLEWRDRSGDNFIELNASLALNAILEFDSYFSSRLFHTA
jgi:hypothetical protein